MKIETDVKISSLLVNFQRSASLDIGGSLIGALLSPLIRLGEADRVDREAAKPPARKPRPAR